MTKFGSIFKSMDEAIFKALEDIKGQPQIQKLVDNTSTLPEEQQKILNHSLSIFVIILPILLTSFIFFQNITQKSEIETRELILEEVAEHSKKKNQLELTGRNIIGPGQISDLPDLQRLVRSALSSRGVMADSVTITDFNQTSVGDGLTQTLSTLNFMGLTTQELTGLIQDLTQRQKVKISALQVERDDSNELLEGSFEIYHFSKLDVGY